MASDNPSPPRAARNPSSLPAAFGVAIQRLPELALALAIPGLPRRCASRNDRRRMEWPA